MADKKLPDNVINLADVRRKKKVLNLESENKEIKKELKALQEKCHYVNNRVAWENCPVHSIRRM